MFDSLKKKISSFFKKEEKILEEKIEPEAPAVEKEIVSEEIKEPVSKEIEAPPQPEMEIPKKSLIPKLTLGTKIKQAIFRKAKISDKDIDSLLADFNLELLEADVALPVADKICQEIRHNLVGKEVSAKEDIQKITQESIRKILDNILMQPEYDFIQKVRSKKPFIILFIGPNGHGKSTSIGKVASYLKKNNLSCVISASDTFRAAAIDQISQIGETVGTKVIKQQYGSDPSAVAFDAIKHAQANSIDVVLIDTAGRSELNRNLMEEMKKIVRVTKPDMKIYVGEALAGNAAVDEAKKFDELIGLDGIIMSKTDTDVKGGSILSVSYITKKPIIFLGTGQAPEDLTLFTKEWFINKILT
jgi:fused signal recognition particle receptor